jgi:hypothetical protein
MYQKEFKSYFQEYKTEYKKGLEAHQSFVKKVS